MPRRVLLSTERPTERPTRRRGGSIAEGATAEGIVGDASSVDQFVYERIHQAIIEQRLPPGTKLAEEPLSSLFGVSRAHIRRVLLRLNHSKAVELRPNRGAYVAQPSAHDAREVFTARRIIEAHLVACVANDLTTEQRQQLERHVALEHAAHERGDRGAAIRLSGEFHVLLAQIAGIEVLTRFLLELVSRTSLIIALYGGPGLSYCAYDDHRALLAELAAGRAQEAVDLMTRHLERIEARLDLDRIPGTSVDLREVFGEREGSP